MTTAPPAPTLHERQQAVDVVDKTRQLYNSGKALKFPSFEEFLKDRVARLLAETRGRQWQTR